MLLGYDTIGFPNIQYSNIGVDVARKDNNLLIFKLPAVRLVRIRKIDIIGID